MHNAPLLMRGDRAQALIHTDDARQRGIADGDQIVVRSPFGKVEIPATLTEDIVVAAVAIPHGWGTTAKAAGGWPTAWAASTSTT